MKREGEVTHRKWRKKIKKKHSIKEGRSGKDQKYKKKFNKSTENGKKWFRI